VTETYRVGLLGHGTVGSAFAELLAQRADSIVPITGLRPEISGILTRSRGSFDEVLEGSDLIVELMGGLEPARDYVLAAMRAGKHVVSANKQLLAAHGEELWACAREHGVQLRFEGAVAGVVPVIRVLQESLAASRVERIHGIVNGTTNYILTEMAGRGLSYEGALRQAQELGYAEADPTDDVTGRDAAAKMAILARLAFSTPVHLDQVVYEGIEHLTGEDMEYAKEFGLGLKLVGTAERVNGGISVRVHPAFLYAAHPLRRRAADGDRGAGRRGLGHDPARLDAGDDRGAARGQRRRVGVLPAPRGRRPARRARAGRRATGHAGRLDPIGRAEGPGRERAARADHAPAAGVAVLRGRAADRAARLHALGPARDPRDRRGVQLTGLIERWRDRLPFGPDDPVVSLSEGSTPLVLAERVSERAGCEVWLKLEGANPTGSFKDRGMTCAVSAAVREGAHAVICASTGNTAASAAAYAARAGLTGAVIVPEGKIATGKLAQALMHGARVVALRGNFDEALRLVRELVQRHPIALVNSVNPYRLEGQKTAALEVAEELGSIDALAIPVGNAGNITAYWKGFQEMGEAPMMLGFQAEGAAPLVRGEPVPNPETVASAIRIGNPARWEEAMQAMTASHGSVRAVSDAQILEAYRFLAAQEGVFCEPASATSVAGVLVHGAQGAERVVCVLTGHGLKDPQTALAQAGSVVPCEPEIDAVESAVLG
jgi:threonine synthase